MPINEEEKDIYKQKLYFSFKTKQNKGTTIENSCWA
jgi:hypothetical protein